MNGSFAGLCKYSAGAFGYLSAMISVELKSPNEGNRLGKIGGAILDRYDDPSQVPIYNLYYYGEFRHSYFVLRTECLLT